MDDPIKEMLRKFALETYGSLDETDEHYSFEQTWDRFNKAMDVLIRTPPMSAEMKKRKAKKANAK